MRLASPDDVAKLGLTIPLGSGKTSVYGHDAEFTVKLTTRGFLLLTVETIVGEQYYEVLSFNDFVASWLTEFSHDDPFEVLDIKQNKESGPHEKG
jgi:hypothetical protein